MRNVLFIALISTALSLIAGSAAAQTAEKRLRIEIEKIKALEQTELKILEGEDRLVIDYGGWINFRYDDYKNDDNDSSAEDSLDYIYSADFRLWMKATLKPPPGAAYKNEHSLYIRLKDLHTNSYPKDINDGYDHDGPHLDYGYFLFNFNPYLLEVGRRYYSVGQGIAYGNLHDGLEFRSELEYWTLKALVSHTLRHEDNIDTSVPGWDKKSSRFFYGLEGTYLGIPNQGLYFYLVVQKDESPEDPEDPLRDYTYDSEYLGLGSQGKITDTIHYWAEIIRQTGESRVYATGEKRDIRAWAVDLGATYDLDVYSHPNFTIEYAYGSGDADRTSVTDTQNGNTSGDDNNFNYFGYLPTGYAFSPRLSNIYFIKAGVLLKPLEKYDLFEIFTFGIDYYRYYKAEETGGISDIDASVNDDDLGFEIDLNISWQILSDLSCSFEYGYFKPGNAFPDTANDSEKYFSISTTITF